MCVCVCVCVCEHFCVCVCVCVGGFVWLCVLDAGCHDLIPYFSYQQSNLFEGNLFSAGSRQSLNVLQVGQSKGQISISQHLAPRGQGGVLLHSPFCTAERKLYFQTPFTGTAGVSVYERVGDLKRPVFHNRPIIIIREAGGI